MITKEQANRLRGLIATHARAQWVMGVTQFERGMPVNKGIPERAEAASKAVFDEVRKLTEPPSVVEKEWRHDVADNGYGLHIVMRGKRYSLCTQVDMEKRDGLQFVGAWDDGQPPTCEHCLRVWASMRRDDKEPNNYFDPGKEKS